MIEKDVVELDYANLLVEQTVLQWQSRIDANFERSNDVAVDRRTAQPRSFARRNEAAWVHGTSLPANFQRLTVLVMTLSFCYVVGGRDDLLPLFSRTYPLGLWFELLCLRRLEEVRRSFPLVGGEKLLHASVAGTTQT